MMVTRKKGSVERAKEKNSLPQTNHLQISQKKRGACAFGEYGIFNSEDESKGIDREIIIQDLKVIDGDDDEIERWGVDVGRQSDEEKRYWADGTTKRRRH